LSFPFNDPRAFYAITPSVRPISERENVSERYVARMLRLAWLAPDIVRKVTQGDVPNTLTLRRLQQGYPLDWAQQQSALLAQ
jgi:site-specific DNA recombinase